MIANHPLSSFAYCAPVSVKTCCAFKSNEEPREIAGLPFLLLRLGSMAVQEEHESLLVSKQYIASQHLPLFPGSKSQKTREKEHFTEVC